MSTTPTDVADRLFDAIERGDLKTVVGLFDPDVTMHKTGDARDSDRARLVKIISGFIASTAERHYRVLDRRQFDGGFVQQHVLHATTAHRVSIAARVCIVVRFGPDGLITRIDEYFDPAELRPLLTDGSQ